MPNDTFICPYPLVYADSSKVYAEKFSTHWAYKEGNCAVRCPSVVLTVDEFSNYSDNVNRIAVVSLVLSLFVLVLHLPDIKRYYMRVLFMSGFTLSSICFVFFIPYNKDYQAVCSEDFAHYIEQEPVCVLQATLLVFSFLWIALWGAVYAVDTYLVTLLLKKSILVTLRSYYTWFVVFTSTLLASIGLMADAYGYDYTTSLPNCMFLYADGKDVYFWWVLLFPYSLCVTTCIVASMGTAYRLHSVFVTNRIRPTAGQSRMGVVPGSSIQRYHTRRNKRVTRASLTPSEVSRDDIITKEVMGREWSADADTLSFATNDSTKMPGTLNTALVRHTVPSDGEKKLSQQIDIESANPLHDKEQLVESGGKHGGNGQVRLIAVPEGGPGMEEVENTTLSICQRDNDSNWRDSRWDERSSKRDDLTLEEDVRDTTPSIELADYRVDFIDDNESQPRDTNSVSYIYRSSGGTSHDDPSDQSRSSGQLPWSKDSPSSAVRAPGAWLHNLSWTFSETWKYNGRVLIFIGVYCMLSLYVIPTFIFLFHSTYDHNVQSSEDWIECLVVYSFLSPEQTQSTVDKFTQDMCGPHPVPRPHYSLVRTVF